MARIIKIEKLERNRNSIHSEVECTYCTFSEFGKKYIQIDTYGTEQRQVKNQPSQKIQFDKDTAIRLIEILNKEFNI